VTTVVVAVPIDVVAFELGVPGDDPHAASGRRHASVPSNRPGVIRSSTRCDPKRPVKRSKKEEELYPMHDLGAMTKKSPKLATFWLESGF
jgi:hypothetical protein